MKAMPLVRFIGPIFLLALFLSSCGDDGSGVSNSVTVEESSSSAESSNSEKKDFSSSSIKTEGSSSSVKTEESLSSKDLDKSSSSIKNEGSSSSTKTDESSSSKIPDESSSSDKPVESSSSMAKSSSSEISSSSVKLAESSSSEMSSSSIKPEESSSSTKESSSSVKPADSSSSEESSSSAARSSSSEKSSSSAKSSSSVSSSSALKSIYDAENNTLTDLRDGRVYKTTTIGTQIWMAENLNYLPKDTAGTYFGGRSVCGGGEYKSLQEGDCSIYGRLYEIQITAYDGYNKNICPDGWKIPANTQWEILINYLGSENAGQKLKLANEAYWPGELPTNESGFSAIPSGYYSKYYGFNKVEDKPIAQAVFTIKNSKTIEKNAVKVLDSQNGVKYLSYGDSYFIAVRCIRE